LQDIANVEKLIPRDWLTDDGFLPNEKFIEYARPLIEGEVRVPMEGGLPRFVALDKVMLAKKLPQRA
jgi:6-phosphofructokinase 1